jgi:hypothetical protein
MNTPIVGGFVGGRTYSTSKVMRSSRFFAAPPPPAAAPKSELEGLGLVKSVVINEFEPIEGSIPFEVMVDGKQLWFGMGDDRVDGLLRAMMAITGQEPEAPDN